MTMWPIPHGKQILAADKYYIAHYTRIAILWLAAIYGGMQMITGDDINGKK